MRIVHFFLCKRLLFAMIRLYHTVQHTVNESDLFCNLLHKSNLTAIFMQFIVYLHNKPHGGGWKRQKGSCRFAILLLKRQPPLKGIFYLIITWQNIAVCFLVFELCHIYFRKLASLKAESYPCFLFIVQRKNWFSHKC